MISFVFLTVMSLIMNGETVIFDFNSPTSDNERMTINDDVMGGISKSKFQK